MNTSTLSMSGVTGAREAALGWFLLAVSIVVVLVVSALVLMAALRRRDPAAVDAASSRARDLRWITVGGIIVPVIILTIAFLFTVFTIDAVGSPAIPVAVRITVTGHQWWWEATYHDSATANDFTTANEIHVPVGQPVRFDLQSNDVIHSFWVPALAGKVDVIPGQHNTLWIEAREAGTYGGPCGEYCGTQHAHMRVTVIAQSPADFHNWLRRERQAATPPDTGRAATGFAAFSRAGCAVCHSIRGTSAGGGVGPDLTHVASRQSLGAGVIANSPATLAAWITGAQIIKPGCDMPNMSLSGDELHAVVAYLETLR